MKILNQKRRMVNGSFTSVTDRPHCRKSVNFHLTVIGLGVAAGGTLPVSREVLEIGACLDWLGCHDLALVLFHPIRIAEDRVIECLGLSDCRVIDMTAHHTHILVHRDNLVFVLLTGNIILLSFTPY
jgi:hypothetical protein